jgi:hypothetical protein
VSICATEFLSDIRLLPEPVYTFKHLLTQEVAYLGLHCSFYAPWALWWLGYRDRALQRSREIRTWARELSHPPSLATALFRAARLHQLRRERQAVHELTKELMTLSTEHGFAPGLALGTMMCGWGHTEQGQAEEGMVQLRQGLDARQATGTALGR